MNAQICDRCGVIWYDSTKCELDIRTLILREADSNNDNKYDLCEDCRRILYQYLNSRPEIDSKDNVIRIFK